jgi:GH43 family beta-xylosidase
VIIVKTIWAIDLTVTSIHNQLYAIWSGWERNNSTDKTPQHLYIAKMENPWTISSERVKISSPLAPWETGGPLDINEGPEVLQHNDAIFIIYSTRESWTAAYRLGQFKIEIAFRSNACRKLDKEGPCISRYRQGFGYWARKFYHITRWYGIMDFLPLKNQFKAWMGARS